MWTGVMHDDTGVAFEMICSLLSVHRFLYDLMHQALTCLDNQMSPFMSPLHIHSSYLFWWAKNCESILHAHFSEFDMSDIFLGPVMARPVMLYTL